MDEPRQRLASKCSDVMQPSKRKWWQTDDQIWPPAERHISHGFAFSVDVGIYGPTVRPEMYTVVVSGNGKTAGAAARAA